MAKFHLMHCVPHPKMHGLNGYSEVIESVGWGLEQLGHAVSYSLNTASPTATNIIFGAQVIPTKLMPQLPRDTIIYNFEQLRGVPEDWINPQLHYCAEHFQIWEYSQYNQDTWKTLGATNPKVVPVGYAPILTRIPKSDIQDIDILIYGLSGNKRLNVFHRLSQAGLKILFVSGLYGEARDALIARSKIILNVNLYDSTQIFEIVRVSYLLANKKAVVATLDPNTALEKDVIDSIKFTNLENIVENCVRLLENDDERLELEMAGYENFTKRDIKQILQIALSTAQTFPSSGRPSEVG